MDEANEVTEQRVSETAEAPDMPGQAAKGPRCQCLITDRMAWAGPAVALCHHSTAAEANDVREKLLDVLGDFTQTIDPNTMFNKTLLQLAEDYRQQVVGKMEMLLNEDEHNIVNINFMRSLSLAIEMIMCTMIVQRNQPADEGQAE